MDSPALEVTEKYSAALSTGPRVTLDSMRAKIISETYFTLGAAFDALDLEIPSLRPEGAVDLDLDDVRDICPLDVYTLCVLVLANGWVITGHSAPASADNFDPEKGKTFAYEKAINQLWPLEGYLLRDQLAKDSKEATNGEG